MKNWFKPAERRSAKKNVTRTLLQSAVFWGIFLWLIPVAIHNFESALDLTALPFNRQAVAGWILFTMCGSLGISSGVTPWRSQALAKESPSAWFWGPV